MSTPARRRLWAWGGPAVVIVIAALTRLVDLANPAYLVFDEDYYVKDAWSLWNLGYSSTWPTGADASVESGDLGGYSDTAEFVVHPPLGKWIIGVGMRFFGPESPASWRITTAVIGILAVILLMVIARLLFRSTLLTTLAGMLFAIDGNAIVMSRVALLDNSVMFFALLGFLFVLLDRGWSETRLERWRASREKLGRPGDWGPALWWRPWLVAAAVAFGLCSAVKWSGLYFLAGFAIYTLVIDALARRRAGVPHWFAGTVIKQAPVSFLLTVPVALAAHLSTWTSWFLGENGYLRQWATQDGHAWTGIFSGVPASVQSWLHYQQITYQFHVTLTKPNDEQANPLGWLLLLNPTSLYSAEMNRGTDGCLADTCGTYISGVPNPLIWWAAVLAIVYLAYRLLRHRDWRAGLILAGFAFGYLPWLLYLDRTVFQFYTIAFEPYLLLALTLTIGRVLGSRNDPRSRRQERLRITLVFLALAVLISVYFYPVWTALPVPIEFVRAHWWLSGWQ